MIHSNITNWFNTNGWTPNRFQIDAWQAYYQSQHGLINAPTGSGKTYSLWFAYLNEVLQNSRTPKGLELIWITPIKALAKEIHQAIERTFQSFNVPLSVAIRTGDTTAAERAKQKRKMPTILITTPESLHLLIAQKKANETFQNLQLIVIDEWHELLGSKRGVQIELAISYLKTTAKQLKIWGISATIGNLQEALQVLVGPKIAASPAQTQLIQANIHKEIVVKTIVPPSVEEFSWGGHLGIQLLEQVIPILQNSNSTLLFTNTRAQAEIWYQRILDVAPELAGLIAMHHGSISKELRDWVEDALHQSILKAVVCTSSLDLGVDFRPVETIIQIGGPKGVARFIQRAGRSGHQPGAVSTIYFVPTNSLELIEAAALRHAINHKIIENRTPLTLCFDVLVQYLVTRAVGDGFHPKNVYNEVKDTHCFAQLQPDEFSWLLDFITTGGATLNQYDEFKRVKIDEQGVFKVTSKRTALQHRLGIGTIVSDGVLKVKFVSGGFIGTVEEWFVSKLKPGDVFWFAGRSLELFKIKDMQVLVKRSTQRTGNIPAWMGGRMPLSSQLSEVLRFKLQESQNPDSFRVDPELEAIQPLLGFQQLKSHVPAENELLLEQLHTKEGWHLFVYPFEGRFVHEAMANLLAYRIAQQVELSISVAYNDYGFELLSNQPIDANWVIEQNLLSAEHLFADVEASINAAEIAKRKFRDIASISGMVFRGYPGKQKADRHLQSSAQLLFNVLQENDSNHLLLQQAYAEVFNDALELDRLKLALERIENQQVVITQPKKPTPLAFPILVDRLRERMSSEKLEDRIAKMTLQFAK